MSIKESELPVMMYIHGFRSGANGSKRHQLQEHFHNEFQVIAPEVDADPEKSLGELNEIIAIEQPSIIVGTSLGGWMTLMCDSDDAELVVVNPCLYPNETLSQWKDEELEYFCQRLDGIQTYTLTQEILDKYDRYNITEAIKDKSQRTYALCSTHDELLGTSHINTLKPYLSYLPYVKARHLTIVDDFGHRCTCAGMDHLFNILDDIIEQQIVRIIRTKEELLKWMREIGLIE